MSGRRSSRRGQPAPEKLPGETEEDYIARIIREAEEAEKKRKREGDEASASAPRPAQPSVEARRRSAFFSEVPKPIKDALVNNDLEKLKEAFAEYTDPTKHKELFRFRAEKEFALRQAVKHENVEMVMFMLSVDPRFRLELNSETLTYLYKLANEQVNPVLFLENILETYEPDLNERQQLYNWLWFNALQENDYAMLKMAMSKTNIFSSGAALAGSFAELLKKYYNDKLKSYYGVFLLLTDEARKRRGATWYDVVNNEIPADATFEEFSKEDLKNVARIAFEKGDTNVGELFMNGVHPLGRFHRSANPVYPYEYAGVPREEMLEYLAVGKLSTDGALRNFWSTVYVYRFQRGQAGDDDAFDLDPNVEAIKRGIDLVLSYFTRENRVYSVQPNAKEELRPGWEAVKETDARSLWYSNDPFEIIIE